MDTGIVANPEMAGLQFESAAVFGTSIGRFSEITLEKGRVVESNFHDYTVARMNQAPKEINVQFVESDAPPEGVGEPGVPPYLPALGNAIFAATGKRIREVPLTKTNLAKGQTA